MKEYEIKIDEKHLETREGLVRNGFLIRDVRSRLFRSFDRDFLEQQINDFLDDAIYVKHKAFELTCDISKVDEFTGDKMINYAVVVEYVEWPF